MDEEAINPPAISIRRMREEETQTARSLAGLAFSRPENAAFCSPPPQTLVAERDGRLVGAVVPKVFALPHRRRCGAIFWLMTDPSSDDLIRSYDSERPGELSPPVGQPMQGPWVLRVSDRARADVGTLRKWSIEIESASV